MKSDTKPAIPARAAANPLRQWLIRYGAYPFIAAAVVMGFAYVYRFGVNVIWEDQWDNLLPVLQSWYNGTLSFSDFWSLHSEHRMLFPESPCSLWPWPPTGTPWWRCTSSEAGMAACPGRLPVRVRQDV